MSQDWKRFFTTLAKRSRICITSRIFPDLNPAAAQQRENPVISIQFGRVLGKFTFKSWNFCSASLSPSFLSGWYCKARTLYSVVICSTWKTGRECVPPPAAPDSPRRSRRTPECHSSPPLPSSCSWGSRPHWSFSREHRTAQLSHSDWGIREKPGSGNWKPALRKIEPTWSERLLKNEWKSDDLEAVSAVWVLSVRR